MAGELCAHVFDDFCRDIGRRDDWEDRARGYWPERHRLPSWRRVGLVQDDGIGAVEKFSRRGFEVCCRGVQDGEIKIRAQPLHDAVGFKDDVVGTGEAVAQRRDRLGQSSLLRADPEYARSASNQKTGGVRLPCPVVLF